MSDLIKAAKLWAKVSAKTGGTYFVGRMGGCRVLVMENRDRQGDGDPSHFLLLGDAEAGQERPPAGQGRRPETVAMRAPARHQDGGDGWRGSQYRRPVNGPQRAPVADDGPFPD